MSYDDDDQLQDERETDAAIAADIAEDEADAPVTLSANLKAAAKELDRRGASYLVKQYYLLQETRLRLGAQLRTSEAAATMTVLKWTYDEFHLKERQMKTLLHLYAKSQVAGRWLLSQKGIGPVMAAGLLAHIDITRAHTAGAIWRYAGLEPTLKWEKGQKRPWNAELKKLCFLIGKSFVLVSNRPNAEYGLIYRARKALEEQRNQDGLLKGEAERAMANKRFGDDTKAKAAYLQGMLPPGHIDMRARRYAVKILLSDLHAVLRDVAGMEPVKPYALGILGHVDLHTPPGWPLPAKVA